MNVLTPLKHGDNWIKIRSKQANAGSYLKLLGFFMNIYLFNFPGVFYIKVEDHEKLKVLYTGLCQKFLFVQKWDKSAKMIRSVSYGQNIKISID